MCGFEINFLFDYSLLYISVLPAFFDIVRYLIESNVNMDKEHEDHLSLLEELLIMKINLC